MGAELAQIGVTGLAVMGRNLARNFARHGYRVAVHNRSNSKIQSLIADHGTEGTFVPSESMEDFVASLERPRRVVIMVKAGGPTDAVIDELVPLLEEGDIVIDAGNAHFPDTIRSEATLRAYGLHFVGSGVSGGEEGALNGPSIMPGGFPESYRTLGPMLEDISARYTAAGHGFDLRRAAGGWRLYTRPEYAAYVERFVLDGQSVRLTQAALETLAVVAYKQPVTRSRISAIRGVNCDGVMRTLVTRGLIEECGTEGETGAYLYRTTGLFLEKLGLNSVDQLPPLAPFLPDDVEEVLDASG